MNELTIRLRRALRIGSEESERRFLCTHRIQGLPLLRWAFLAGAGVLLVFVVYRSRPPVQEEWVSQGQAFRLLAAVLLLAGYIAITRYPSLAARRYLSVVGLPIFAAHLALAGVVASTAGNESFSSYRSVGSIAIACWLTFGFARLPNSAAAVICAVPSAAYLWVVALVSDDGFGAVAIFVIAFNLIGWVVGAEQERVERLRFHQQEKLAKSLEMLAEKTADAERTSSQATRLLRFVSHDMRQPVLSLDIYLNRLKSHTNGEQGSDWRDVLDNASECLDALRNDLNRLLTRECQFADPSFQVRLHAFDPGELIKRINSVYGTIANECGIRLRLRGPTRNCRNVTSDPDALWVVLSNLVSNAIKHRQAAKPWVLVSFVALPGFIRISVVGNNGKKSRSGRKQNSFENQHGDMLTSYGLGMQIIDAMLSRMPEHRISTGRGAMGHAVHLYVPLGPAWWAGRVA